MLSSRLQVNSLRRDNYSSKSKRGAIRISSRNDSFRLNFSKHCGKNLACGANFSAFDDAKGFNFISGGVSFPKDLILPEAGEIKYDAKRTNFFSLLKTRNRFGKIPDEKTRLSISFLTEKFNGKSRGTPAENFTLSKVLIFVCKKARTAARPARPLNYRWSGRFLAFLLLSVLIAPLGAQKGLRACFKPHCFRYPSGKFRVQTESKVTFSSFCPFFLKIQIKTSLVKTYEFTRLAKLNGMPSVGFEPTTNGLCLPSTAFAAADFRF